VRVGIATGEVIVGMIGSHNILSYTIIGDIANLSSRLEGANKEYGTQVLATSQTLASASAAIIGRRLDLIRVPGRTEPVEICEILGEADAPNADVLHRRCEMYALALQFYTARDFPAAAATFAGLVQSHPDDSAAATMRDRCRQFAERSPPDSDWDGVWSVLQK
jgi:adenylate cyclase